MHKTPATNSLLAGQGWLVGNIIDLLDGRVGGGRGWSWCCPRTSSSLMPSRTGWWTITASPPTGHLGTSRGTPRVTECWRCAAARFLYAESAVPPPGPGSIVVDSLGTPGSTDATAATSQAQVLFAPATVERVASVIDGEYRTDSGPCGSRAKDSFSGPRWTCGTLEGMLPLPLTVGASDHTLRCGERP